jgi:hypothetical protein
MIKTINKDLYAEAFDKTIIKYEELIKDPLKHIKKWKNYGTAEDCRFCKINKKYENDRCIFCPLFPCGFRNLSDIIRYEIQAYLIQDNSFDVNKLVLAAKKRLEWLEEKKEEFYKIN